MVLSVETPLPDARYDAIRFQRETIDGVDVHAQGVLGEPAAICRFGDWRAILHTSPD